ncbi:MAG: carboxypeptidase regulatory-like domain-containing protein [Terriglobia bacterium]
MKRQIVQGLACVLLFGAAVAWASITGSISGVVRDSSGAVIPGVSVAALDTQTGVRQVVVTDGKGFYNFPALSIGTYEVDVQHTGFQHFHETGLIINANSALRVDVELVVGEQSQQVTVSSSVLHVETRNTQMGEVIGSARITAVPLNGRSFTDLLALQPGVSPYSNVAEGGDRPASGDIGNSGNESVNGQREAANGFMVNGANVEEGRNNGAAVVPNLDSIAEFRIITNNFDAEYGNYSGGQVNVATKAGTNQFHGDAFDFLRNTSLDTRNFYSPTIGAYIQNQFGGTFGGPIKRDKAFFFADYQGTRQIQGVDTGQIPVPSAADRQGNLSDQAGSLTGSVVGTSWANTLSNELGYPVTSGEPYYAAGCTTLTQCVFPNAVIPQSAIAAPATKMMQYIPLPNLPGNNYSTSAYDRRLRDDKGGVRVDGNSRFGLLSGYYFMDDYTLNDPYHNAPEFPGFNAITPGRAMLLDLADTKTLSSNAVNQFHFSYLRDANVYAEPVGGVGPTLSSLGFQEGFSTPGGIGPVVPKLEGVPLMQFNNFNFGLPDGTTGQYNNTFQWLDNYTRIIGTHSVKFGGEFHYDQINERNTYAENGVFGFNGTETGLDFADYLIGAPASLTQSSRQFLDSRSKYTGLFAQDSWRARPSLTLNYGLRWEFSQPWYDTQNKTETIIPGEQSVVFPGAPKGWLVPGDPGIPQTLAPTKYDGFSPRIGLAYSPAIQGGLLGKLTGGPGKTSIRMGYGMFYTSVEDLTQFVEVGDAPYGFFYVSPAPPLFATPYIDRATGNSEGQRFPFVFPPINSSAKNPDTTFNWPAVEPISGAPVFFHTNRMPYAEDYEVSLQRQLGAATVLGMSYVGTQGHDLISFLESNPGNQALCLALSNPAALAPGQTPCGPNLEANTFVTAAGQTINGTRTLLGNLFASNAYMDEMANSNYNSLQMSLRHTGARTSFLFGYTYSKCMDNSSAYNQGINPLDFRASKALCNFDLTHNFVASYSYELPFGRLAFANSPVGSRLLKGWIISGITRFATGLPVSLSENDDRSLLGTNTGVDLPNVSSGKILNNTNPRSGQTYFNTSLFSPEPLGQIGDANRRFFHGPGINDFDLTLQKDVNLTESKKLELRIEAFNAFNHAQFNGPDGNFNSGSFGLVNSASDPRILQVAMKFLF